MSHSPTSDLSEVGVSIWLDDLSRGRIESGNLAELIETRNVVGVTTNPTIFANALSKGEGYADRISACAGRGLNATEAIFELTTSDVADACDILSGVFEATGGRDGRVSIEVEPSAARDADRTLAEAKQLWERVGKKNAMIKIPATREGLVAISDTIAEGISVNVTLIFSLQRYREVINAYLDGLERAREAGIDLSTIHSVASFFVSRVDSEIDKRLDALGTDEARELKGKAGIANARLAYEVFEQSFASERAKLLLEAGANAQRPLWASTGVKDPALPDTLYVTELAAPGTVNTMPEATLEALADHGVVTGDEVSGTYREADQVLNAIDALGIDYVEVTELLEAEGLQKFDASWGELVESVEQALQAAR
ncbi:transaldolase [Leucobacter sp. CSA1]|uniref:Transaldolase n=1 Tax=Leucobacter chromiisoli TaxID=2796471 RepID=A0A934UUJ3_9MICO|nr:transaldolase [Leucobacter chromiisoli]MBK0417992.1 transaldolase [Leucobacter chromiisoli]